MDEIDKILSQVQADNRETTKTPKQQFLTKPNQLSSDIDSLLAEVKADLPDLPAKPKTSINNTAAIERILLQVKGNYDEKCREELQLKAQELQSEQLQQTESLKMQAKAWLKQLDPLSTEGLWFESFAEGYPTKLAAAINYLQEF